MIDSSHRPAAKSLASASFKSGQSIASCRASASRQKSGWRDPWTRGPRRSAPARRDRVRGGVEQPLPRDSGASAWTTRCRRNASRLV